MRVAVVGGTGVVGRLVVQRLRDRGDEPVVVARSTGVDVTTGGGLDDALAGVAAVVDVSGPASVSRAACVRFAEQATGHLLGAGQRAGVQHHVALSIVGVDRVDTGYYAGKRRQEELVLAGTLPATVLRATQFHEFAGQVLARTRRGPLAVVPRMRVQPVAADEVAEALVALVGSRRARGRRTSAARRCTSCPTSPGGWCGPGASGCGCSRCPCRAPPGGRRPVGGC